MRATRRSPARCTCRTTMHLAGVWGGAWALAWAHLGRAVGHIHASYDLFLLSQNERMQAKVTSHGNAPRTMSRSITESEPTAVLSDAVGGQLPCAPTLRTVCCSVFSGFVPCRQLPVLAVTLYLLPRPRGGLTDRLVAAHCALLASHVSHHSNDLAHCRRTIPIIGRGNGRRTVHRAAAPFLAPPVCSRANRAGRSSAAPGGASAGTLRAAGTRRRRSCYVACA